MKIILKNIMPNPYRGMKQYPIDRAKIESLKISIKETSFWDNILVRPHPTKKGKYQIAYGHHRYITLKELDYKEIDIPVRDLTDAMIIKIMAEENLNWTTMPEVMVQTVDSVRKYLKEELAKYKTWEDYKKSQKLLGLFEGHINKKTGKPKNPKAIFGQVIGEQGIGAETISKFLGGNWNTGKIDGALGILDDDKLDKEVVKTLPSMYQVGEFRKAVKDYNVPKMKQKEIAEKIVKKEIKGRSIRAEVRKQTSKKKKIPIDPKLIELENMIDDINNQAQALDNKIRGFKAKLNEYEVTNIKGTKTLITLLQLQELTKTLTSLFINNNKPKQIEGKTK